MKIVVIGGTGLIGSKLVAKLNEEGHNTVAASPDTGVNTITGEGLTEALEGADVVVDVANAPVWEDAAVMDFFQTSTRNMLARYFGTELEDHSLTRGSNARIAPTRFEDWLSQSGTMTTLRRS